MVLVSRFHSIMLRFPFVALASFVTGELVHLIFWRYSLAIFTNLVTTMTYIIGADWTFPMSSIDDKLLSFDSSMSKGYLFYFSNSGSFPHRSYTISLCIWHIPSWVGGKPFRFRFWASFPSWLWSKLQIFLLLLLVILLVQPPSYIN